MNAHPINFEAIAAAWLADITPNVTGRELVARAEAASRYLKGGRRHG